MAANETLHIACPHCDTINRVPRGKDARKAKCGRCHKPLFTDGSIAASGQKFAVHIRDNDIPVVVDFWAQWCGPCKIMAPAYERVAAELEPEVRFLKVDVEREQDLAARYGIQSIPTLMMFWKGAVLAQHAGAVDAAMLRSWVRQHLDMGAFQSG